MDAERIMDALETLTAADLRRVRAKIEELYGVYEAGSRPPEDAPAQERKYRAELVRCGKPECKKCGAGGGHGPYWYAYWVENGRTRKQYLGKHKPVEVDTDGRRA